MAEMVFPASPGALLLHVLIKCSKFLGKPVRAQPAGQKYENFEKLTPELFKMSFFMKFKTSCALPPYYSTEPMKYALRVIF